MTIGWPSALVPTSGGANLRNATRGGGVTLTGREQRVYQDAGFWEISYSFTLRTSDQVRAWRAMVARLRDGEDIAVQVFDRQRPGLTGADTATLSAPAALRAREIAITGEDITAQAGDHLSIAGRLHVIREVLSQTGSDTWDDAGNWSDAGEWADGFTFTAQSLRISPPLRAAASAGATVNFGTLTCLCVVADANDGDLDLDLMRFGRPTITFREYL